MAALSPLYLHRWALATGVQQRRLLPASTLSVLTGSGDEMVGSALQTIFSPLTALSYLTFALLYPPCVAALAAIRREMNSGFATLCIMAYEITIAWLMAFAVYHIGMMLGFN